MRTRPDPPRRELLDEDLVRALQSISPRHQVLVLLADVEGLAYKEIAEVLGRGSSTRGRDCGPA